MKKAILLTVALALFGAAATTALGALADLGIPIDPHGFPAYYEDSTGLRLEPCLPPPAGNATLGGGSFCIHDPLDPNTPLVVTGEIFWWLADARMNMPGGGSADLVLAVEGTFGGTEEAIDGQQISFGRVRIRIDTPVAGTYTITHPYGVQVFENVPAGTKAINYTADIGAANFLSPAIGFRGTLASPIGPFLTWPDYATNPALQLRAIDPATGLRTGPVIEQYVGNPNVPSIVTGSPFGTNFFRVQGPNGIDVRTDFFFLMGKVYDETVTANQHQFPGAPPQRLYAVGPVNREEPFNPASTAEVTGEDFVYPVGYPLWYQENSGTIANPQPGLQLTLCTPGDPMCISDPIDPANPAMASLRTGGEGFYWSADAVMDLDANNRAVLVLGLEATFGGTEEIVDGQQITFGRLRIRVDAPVSGTYTVTHPYGVRVFENVPAGPNGINYTADIGIIDPVDPDFAMVGTLYSDIGPSLLKWTTFNPNPALTDPRLVKPYAGGGGGVFEYYVGDPGIPHEVTGSPFGTNYFRVQGPNGIDVQTNLFAVSGKIYDPATFQFAVNPAAPVAVTDSANLNLATSPSVTVNVLANDNPRGQPVTALTVLPAGENFGPAGGTVEVNADNTVTYTPNPGFSGTDTFAYRFTIGTGLTSNIAIVTVTVIPVETIAVTRARLDLRRLEFDIRGTSNFEGTTLTIHAGPTVSGPVIGTALVANGRFSLRTAVTGNPNVNSISIVSSSAGGTTLLNQPLQLR